MGQDRRDQRWFQNVVKVLQALLVGLVKVELFCAETDGHTVKNEYQLWILSNGKSFF
jgi:hypothetical protein